MLFSRLGLPPGVAVMYLAYYITAALPAGIRERAASADTGQGGGERRASS